jgi:hypothetical protein
MDKLKTNVLYYGYKVIHDNTMVFIVNSMKTSLRSIL